MKEDIEKGDRLNIEFHVKPYHKIKVLKGSLVKTTHPMGERIAKRSQVVKTHTSSGPGSEDVTWRGSGSYWFWTKKENCEYFGRD